MPNQNYQWVDDEKQKPLNPLRGECTYDCNYDYMNRLKDTFPGVKNKYTGELELDHIVLNNKIPKTEKPIFVCNCNDLFQDAVPDRWIARVMVWLKQNPANTYLLQTKNPQRFTQFINDFPPKVILATTIETNRDYPNITKAPQPYKRYLGMAHYYLIPFDKMVNIEPIMGFDLDIIIEWLKDIGPNFVSIGADSNPPEYKKKLGYELIEPTGDEVRELKNELSKFTEVRVKHNLNRILEDENNGTKKDGNNSN